MTPIRITIGPEEAVAHDGWRAARERIMAAALGGRGLTLLLGPAGTGKSLLLQEVLRALEGAGATVRRLARGDLLPTLGDVAPGSVLLVDEADRMGVSARARLSKLRDVAVVAAGVSDPAGGDGAAFPEAAVVRLLPLPAAEVAAFVAARMAASGLPAGFLSAAAMERLADRSRGVPRVLNMLAAASVFLARSDGAARVDAAHVEQADLLREGRSEAAPLPPAADNALARSGVDAGADSLVRARCVAVTAVAATPGRVEVLAPPRIAVEAQAAPPVAEMVAADVPVPPALPSGLPSLDAFGVLRAAVPPVRSGAGRRRLAYAGGAAVLISVAVAAALWSGGRTAPTRVAKAPVAPAIVAPAVPVPAPEAAAPAEPAAPVPAAPVPAAPEPPAPVLAAPVVLEAPPQTAPTPVVALPSGAPVLVSIRFVKGGAGAQARALAVAEVLRAGGFQTDGAPAPARVDAKPGARVFYDADRDAAGAVLRAAGMDGAVTAVGATVAAPPRPGAIELTIPAEPGAKTGLHDP